MATKPNDIKTPNLSEIGSSGLITYGGQISEENLRKLAGTRGIKTFAEMRDNDDTVGAILFIIDKLLRNVDWTSEPADESPESKRMAEFLDSCLTDMEHSWGDMISEILSMLPFGWSSHEIVYKVRTGLETSNPSYYSEYDDGMIGWRKLPIRSQETLESWEFNESGDVIALNQLIPLGGSRRIPVEKLLLFKTQSYKNNPMGRSILRNAYRPWFFKKRIEEVEGIGIERDLAGLPVAGVPAEILASNATAEQKATLSAIKKLVTNIRRDEQEGVVFPLVYNENGNKLYTLDLLSTGGTRQFDTNSIITRYSKAIAMTVLADFIFLGQTKVGSYALSSDKTDMFSASLGAWLKSIADVFNKQAIPRLMRLNNIERKYWPKLKPSDIEKENVKDFCDNIYKLVGVGALMPDDAVDQKIRQMLSLDPAPANTPVVPMDLIEQRLNNEKKTLEVKTDKPEDTKNPKEDIPEINRPNRKSNPGIAKK
jgi:hypothetical protein